MLCLSFQSAAIVFERGLVLRNLLMALGDLITFAQKNDIQGDWDFASVFIGLTSSRPSVCAEALDRFADLRTLGVRTVYQQFQKCIKDSSRISPAHGVVITLCQISGGKQAVLSLPLLQAAAVLLSIWKEKNGATSKHGKVSDPADEIEAAGYVSHLANMLLHPIESQGSGGGGGGLSSAKMLESEKSAVSVESVSFCFALVLLRQKRTSNPLRSGLC